MFLYNFFFVKKKDVFIENVFYKKNMFLMAESPSPFTIFRVIAKIPGCSHILSLKLCVGNIAVTTLKFIYIARTFLYEILFNLSISRWKLIKIEHKLKCRNNHDLTKPTLSVSGIKLLKLVYTPLKVFFEV